MRLFSKLHLIFFCLCTLKCHMIILNVIRTHIKMSFIDMIEDPESCPCVYFRLDLLAKLNWGR